MNPKSALDSIVAHIAAIDVHLSGDDSPLANPWEEIKEQLQTELSHDWEAYLMTVRQIIAGFVFELSPATLSALSSSLGCSSPDRTEQELLKRLLQRGKKDKVKYRAFDFSYFCYPLLDFTVYARVIERTGWHSCMVTAYSAAAPSGERGEVNTNNIDRILTQEDFEKARSRGWPDRWEFEDHAQTLAKQRRLSGIPAADAASVSADDFATMLADLVAEKKTESSQPGGTSLPTSDLKDAAGHIINGASTAENALTELFGPKDTPYLPSWLSEEQLTNMKDRLSECMPHATMIFDLRDWDIYFEDDLSDDWYFETVFGSVSSLESCAHELAEFFLKKCDEYDIDYDQSRDRPEFERLVLDEASQFILQWRKNIFAQYAQPKG